MKTILFFFAFAFSLVSRSHGKVEDPPAIAISIKIHEGTADPILVVAWPDGMMVWSKDQVKGGPPFLTAKVDEAKIHEFLTRLEKEQVFKKDADFLVQIGPDASHHSIQIRAGNRQVELLSWHELFEKEPKLVATSRGISSLDGKSREEVLKADTKEYQQFRKLWNEIRDFTRTLIPREGTPYEQPLKLKFGE